MFSNTLAALCVWFSAYLAKRRCHFLSIFIVDAREPSRAGPVDGCPGLQLLSLLKSVCLGDQQLDAVRTTTLRGLSRSVRMTSSVGVEATERGTSTDGDVPQPARGVKPK